jgi:hypothetical protein
MDASPYFLSMRKSAAGCRYALLANAALVGEVVAEKATW